MREVAVRAKMTGICEYRRKLEAENKGWGGAGGGNLCEENFTMHSRVSDSSVFVW